MPAKTAVEVPDKDVPLRDDIRLLGRILGDTVREQEGEAAFEIVERIRQTSIRFHRDDEEAARHDLETTLNVYTYTVSDWEKRAVERVAGALFGVLDSVGLNPAAAATPGGRPN